MVQDNNPKTVYSNSLGNNNLIITEHNRKRDYNPSINKIDKIYRIKITGNYQPTIEDVCQMVYYLLKNKVKDDFFEKYKLKILQMIREAELDRNTRSVLLKTKENMDLSSWISDN